MESLTSFLATTPVALFLVPVIIILVVLLVVLNKSHKVEVVAQIPVPPVTTTPAPAQPAEVVAQAIIPPQVVEQESVVSEIAQPIATQHVVAEDPVSAPVIETPAPVVESTPSWRPAEPAPIVEDIPFVPVVEAVAVTVPEETSLGNVVESVPVVAEVIPPQAVATEVAEVLPVAEAQVSAITEEVLQAPVV
jgi:hypothetical protein